MDVVTLQLAKKYTAETVAGAGAIKGDKGDPGQAGPPGPAGADGAPGPKGDPGDTPYIGDNGNWWIGGTDTGVSASGGGGAGTPGPKGDPGTTFTPSVSEAGEISWTNDGGLPNPAPVNIKGPQGDNGNPGEPGPAGKDATINGVNTLTIEAGENVTITQEGGVLTINATGGGGLQLQGIEITTPPDKTAYYPGETFDPAGMVVTADYGYGLKNPVTGYTITPDGPLGEGTGKVTVSYTENGVTVTAEQPITIIPIHIYGASWDGTSTTKWSRTDEAAGFTDPVPYVAGASNYGSPFDNLQPWAGMTIEERTAGTMVKIPKFWYKLEQNTPGTPSSGMTIRIAAGPVEGFSVSPAHMDRGDGKGERDVVYVGRYHCGPDYKSKTGVLPIANITRYTSREEIHKLGSTVWQMDFATRFTIWLLYLIEFADWDSQKTIGLGSGNHKNTEAMGYTDSMPYHTGTSQSSRGIYGLGTQYRNIEGIWDNVGDRCDGCYNNSNGLNIILNPNNFSDTAGGTSIGIPPEGHPSVFTVSNKAGFAMFYPTKANGTTDTYSSDAWYFNESKPIISICGSYFTSKDNGMFATFADPVSFVAPTNGARSMELPNQT